MSRQGEVVTLDRVRTQGGKSLQAFLDEAKVLGKERFEIEAGLASFGSQMPATQRGIYNRRLKDIQRELSERTKLAAAIAAGYEPYMIPGQFAVGFVDQPSDAKVLRLGKDRGALVFNVAMPVEQVKKYFAALSSGLFDEVVIASSDPGLFREVKVKERPRPTYVDPFLIGLVALPQFWNENMRIGRCGNDIRGAQAFLISQWDLSHELAAIER